MSETATQKAAVFGKYTPYANYQDSGVEWLGPIPSSWGTCSVWMKFQLGRGRVISNEEIQDNLGPYPVYSSQTLNDGVMGTIDTFDFDGDYITWTTDGANAGTVFTRQGRFNCTNVCGTLKAYNPNKSELRFYTYALSTATSWFVRHDINPKLMNNVMAAIRIPSLSVAEQCTIAAFLDYETARIDKLIEKQQQLIELLKEKRQAVISHAVTKGLNPDAQMKDSGVERLGEVPKHWVVTSLKYFYTNLDYRRIPLSSEERGDRQGDYPYYGASGIIDGIDDYLFDEECVLVGEDGANLVMRSTPLAFVATGKYWVNNHAHILRMNDGLCSYWTGVINNVDIRPIVSGSAQPKLTAEALGNITITCPPSVAERQEIMNYLADATPKFDRLITKAEHQIGLLKERRTALISAAVTGKIDLRGWQPPAQESADE